MINKLNTKLIINFLILIFILVLSIWFFQIFLLNSSYKLFRKNDIKNSFNQINDIKDVKKLEKIENTNDSYIYVYDNSRNLVYESNNLLPRGVEKEIISVILLSNFKQIDKDIYLTRLDSNYNLYGNIIDDYFVIFVSRLDPIESTTSIMSRQLIYVTIISIIISIIISLRLSKRLSLPIKNINDKSKELGKGNFDIEFNEDEYLEVKELSITLNETTKRLKEKDKLQKEIISNVSHDLKTPLTIIKGYAEVIKDVKGNKKDRDIKLNNIINEVDNLNSMINNLLETSKLELDTYLELNNTDISKIVDKVINRLDKIIMDKNIIIKYDKHKLMSNVDKNKIEQVIYNLLINAINHVGKDNTIIININNNTLEIINHGKGIEDTTHIFDKFYTTHNSKTSNGLGLYIVKTILDKHNIKYGVDSIKNEFTKFWINF